MSTGMDLGDVTAEARRAEIVRRAVGPRVVGSEVPPRFAMPAPHSRDTAQLTVSFQKDFLWKDLVRQADDEMLGYIAEIVELEMSRRGARR